MFAFQSNSPSSPAAVPERQSFNSKLKQFEHEVEVRKAPVSSSKLPKPQLPGKADQKEENMFSNL